MQKNYFVYCKNDKKTEGYKSTRSIQKPPQRRQNVVDDATKKSNFV